MAVTDTLGRQLRDLRISVTDRCNFRCTYCMPKEVFGAAFQFLPRAELLTFEEITRLARLFATLGVRKLRLTGGEPLLRRDLDTLIRMLVAETGIEDIALTTNGSLLSPARAAGLRAAGLRRLTVSLDALDDETFQRMNDVAFPVERVLAAMDAAEAAGFPPVKVDMVVRRGENEQAILPMAERFRGTGRVLRFIEYMDVGNSNGWRLDEVVSAREILATVGERWPLEPVAANYPGEVAERWRYLDGAGEIGVIASVTRAFCGACTRARLSAEGQLYTCLFGTHGNDLRALLRGGATDEQVLAAVGGVWRARDDRYSELRGAATVRSVDRKVEMSHIGG